VSNIVVVSGPSGVGKGTLISALQLRVDNVRLSVSDTTRSPRKNEIDGVNYCFISVQEFRKRIEQGRYLEWEFFFNTYYGTPKSQLENLKREESVVLELDPKGALSVRRSHPSAILIFILPDSLEQLNAQLAGRGTESAEERSIRTARLIEELDLAGMFDYAIINKDLDKAVYQFCEMFELFKYKISNHCDFISMLRKKAGETLNDDPH
jgi:guanylate kinase